jgi:hypothetical protein
VSERFRLAGFAEAHVVQDLVSPADGLVARHPESSPAKATKAEAVIPWMWQSTSGM